ncbi:MAG TPA: LLM class flavin-dependent oxidoreductase, partial [Arthrobacter sp.]|nr:LLM class flavin-dependent oxidoreductase [Arthrobacter sp.]
MGRSIGFTPAVRQALRQEKDGADRFEADLAELLAFLNGEAAVTSRPHDGGATPPFVLATGQGADIAAKAGLAVVVGGPGYTGRTGMPAALARYRRNFRPSRWYPEPYVIVSANIAVAETAAQARELLLPEAWALAQSRTRGEFPPLEPGESILQRQLTGRQQKLIDESLASSIYGDPKEVAEQLARLLDATGANEFMVTG